MSTADDSTHRKSRRELTASAILLGLILSVVMGAANVYLGLKAGMTVSASIPAAVIAMGILQGVLRRGSILESNLVQTAASAGESLAAGIIFTVPALVLVGVWEGFNYWTTTLIAFTGGLLGVLLMIPMRRVFVVDNPELRFPEGLACAEVLRAGQGGGSGTADVFSGLAVGALFKTAVSYFDVIRDSVERATMSGSRVFYFGTDISPALVSVGIIVSLPIAVQMFLGGAIGWLFAMPLLEADTSIANATEAASTLWSSQIRYMGVGAMVVGGIISIWRVRKGLVTAVVELSSQFNGAKTTDNDEPTEKDLPGTVILVLGLLTIGLIGGIYFVLLERSVGITLVAMAAMIVMAFFFTAVASYIVGLVGNSNSPVSGMTITAFLATGLLILLFGYGGERAMLATLGVAGVVCCVACTSGDVCNDLKTGHLVGASPRSQQIMQVGGVLVAALIMAPVMTVLHEGSLNKGTGGLGGDEFPAPQAGLFASLAEGFFGDQTLPYNMIAVGALIGVALLIADLFLAKADSEFRLHVMPVAVGIYLPLELTVPILFGGLLNFAIARASRSRDDGDVEKASLPLKRATLLASGMIAGESLVGVGLGFVAYMEYRTLEWDNLLVSKAGISESLIDAASVAALAAVCAWVFIRARRAPRDQL